MNVSISYKVDGRYSNSETTWLHAALKSRGINATLFQWENLLDAPEIETVLQNGRLVHKHVGSTRWTHNSKYKVYLSKLDSAKVRYVNHSNCYRLGNDKRYLIELASQNIPTLLTHCISSKSVTLSHLNEIADTENWPDLVIKPVDGELAQHVMRLSELTEEQLSRAASRTDIFLLQPFVSEIRAGEKSLACIAVEGKFTPVYGVRRVPKDWIACHAHGALITSEDILDIERDVISLLEECPLLHQIANAFFRVDFIYINGRPYLSELELINPQAGLDKQSRIIQESYLDHFISMLEAI